MVQLQVVRSLEAVCASLIEELIRQFARGNAGVFEHAVRVMANFVVEGPAMKDRPAVDHKKIVEGGGLDVFS